MDVESQPSKIATATPVPTGAPAGGDQLAPCIQTGGSSGMSTRGGPGARINGCLSSGGPTTTITPRYRQRCLPGIVTRSRLQCDLDLDRIQGARDDDGAPGARRSNEQKTLEALLWSLEANERRLVEKERRQVRAILALALC